MLREFRMPTRPVHVTTPQSPPQAASAAQLRPCATVLLLRDGPGGPEVFLLRRSRSMAFAPAMHVFPGGGVDPRDADPGLPWAGPGPEVWSGVLGAPPAQARELVCAAVRELFEECAVLLAGVDAEHVVDDVSDERWETDRRALSGHSLALRDLLLRRSLVLRSDLLHPWAHWVTPVFEPRRYDTRFFVAALPAGQQARQVGEEADHAAWVCAAAAVAAHQEGRLAMLPPTLVALEEIAGYPDVARVLAAPRHVRRVLPWLHEGALRVDLDGVGGGEPGP